MIGSTSNRHNQGRWLLILAGTLTLALAGCEGPAGSDGLNGADGQDGLPGTDGQNGQNGTDGQNGQNGQDGQDGEDGEQGPEGPAGPATWLSAPGVTLEITGAEITAERKVSISWKIVDSKNQPLDKNGRMTEGAFNPSFVVAYLDPTTDRFVSLKTRTETAGAVTVDQATSDSGGTTTEITLGTYEYVTALTVPAELAATTPIRVFGYADRSYQGMLYVGADTYDFTPGGAAPVVREIVTDNACNACHGALTAHGRRRGVDGCITCHTMQSTDAETGNTVDMATMVHKIHTGVDLPSVNEGAAGTFYGISGYQDTMYKYAEKQADGTVTGVEFLRDMRSCDVCHGGARDADRKFTAVSKRACGSCHDSQGTETAHFRNATSDATCAGCHVEGGMAPIEGVHATNYEWAAEQGIFKGITVQLVSVTGVAAGSRPTVQFTAKNADGSNVAIASMYTLRAVFAGPMPVPTWSLTGQDLKAATGPDANGVFTMQVAGTLPDTVVAGDSVQIYIEARARSNQVRDGVTLTITEPVPNAFTYVVAGTDAAAPARAMDVEIASCETCHGPIGNGSLSGHGGQRNSMQACIACHNPTLVDTTGASADMPVMIHKIHGSEMLTQGYTVFGADFGSVVFTRQANDCRACHTGNAWKEPTARACITCHDSDAAAAHAELNTTASGVEACEVCHGAGSTLGADRIHTPVP